jgi:hypothetical protein
VTTGRCTISPTFTVCADSPGGDDLDDDIPIGEDAHRHRAVPRFLDDDERAHVVLAHERRGLARRRAARHRKDVVNAELADTVSMDVLSRISASVPAWD